MGDKPYDVGSKAIRKAAEAGDPHALAAWTCFIDDLARGLANIIAFLNPDVIALGGGVSSAGDFMLNAVRPKVDDLTTMAPKGATRIEGDGSLELWKRRSAMLDCRPIVFFSPR